MGAIGLVLPVIQAIAGYMAERKTMVADKTGLNIETVNRVSTAMTDLLSKDERVAEVIMAEIDKARAHDITMAAANAFPLVALLRGLVRPVITLTAFFWYVYARCSGMELSAEDYAIVGGIMAFWFGLRPFEKTASAKVVARGTPLSGS